jgi:hypothetical protein
MRNSRSVSHSFYLYIAVYRFYARLAVKIKRLYLEIVISEFPKVEAQPYYY